MLKTGVQSSLARGLEQWLWFLGADARNPKENLLVRSGFQKFKPPFSRGSSRYRREWRGGTVELHSFCVGLYPDHADGFIFIRAHHNCFLYTAMRPPWPGRYRKECLIAPETDEEMYRFHAAASRFLEWLEEYERWVDCSYGRGYRGACYKTYHYKWQPPVSGRKWFRRFCRRPRTVKPVTPVVSDMTLLKPNTATTGDHPVPPPLPISPSAVVWPASTVKTS